MKQEAMQSDIRALMKLPVGRRVVWRLLEQAGVWRSVFSPEIDLDTIKDSMGIVN